MVRAYFYAKSTGKVRSFKGYFDNFVSSDLTNARQELATLLSEDFGITIVGTTAQSVGVPEEDLQALYDKLKSQKSESEKARNDANLVLMVYGERTQLNETGDEKGFGYLTWWLSTDRRTHRAVKKAFPKRQIESCYMRPEFLSSYVTLVPSPSVVKGAYRDIFPSFAGVNISAQLDPQVIKQTRKYLNDHNEKSPGRRKAIMKSLVDRLKSEPLDAESLKTFLDEARENLEELPNQEA